MFKTYKLTLEGLLEHMEARLGAVFLSIYHCCSRLSGFTVIFCTVLYIKKSLYSVNFNLMNL